MNFQLYYPVKPHAINQPFGVNRATYAQFGLNGHNGLDLMAYHGQPIYAAHDGHAWYEVDDNQGHGIVIITDTQFPYTKADNTQTNAFYKSIYWHLCDSTKEPQFKSPVEAYTNTLAAGFPVKAGDLIGYADNTGFSTGDHCHFGLKPMMLGYPGESTNIEQDNGYLGAIDPTPYFNGKYAQDIDRPTHTFYIPMQYDDTGSEVLALQRCLQWAGYFPLTQQCTGHYGPITKAAVYQFQQDHLIFAFFSRGSKVGPSTLAALNKVFSA